MRDTVNILFFVWMAALLVLFSAGYILHKYGMELVPSQWYVPEQSDDSRKTRKKEKKREKLAIDDDKPAISDCEGETKLLTYTSRGVLKTAISYTVCHEDYEFDKKHRLSLFPLYLGIDYKKLFTKKTHRIVKLLSEKFLQLKEEKSLSELDLIQIIVASVQHIPYTLVHNDSHREANYPFAVNYHKQLKYAMPDGDWNKPGGCAEYGNPFAVFGPLEVAYHHMADCDSRTLFLFSILKRIGYDVVILNSNIESHSILGVNLSSLKSRYGSAQFKDSTTGKTYTIWETTISLPPGVYQNFVEKNWFVALY
jgi:hypothetical protein